MKWFSDWHTRNPACHIRPLRETHSVGCAHKGYIGAYYGGEAAKKCTRYQLDNYKALMQFFYRQVQLRAPSIKSRSSEQMQVAAKQIAAEWWTLIQQHPDMNIVRAMGRCCKQLISKSSLHVQPTLGNSKKRDAKGNVKADKGHKCMSKEDFCHYFNLPAIV